MFILKAIWAFLTSRWLWIFIGLSLLSFLIWIYGPIIAFGEARPLADELVRVIIIAVIFLIWLFLWIRAKIRAARANRSFMADLAPPPPKEVKPGEEELAEVSAKFQNTLDELNKRKLGGKKFLREMPWYVIIGPPGTGKTTALRQSGLNFPFDLTDDLHGVGGTRNCDWFFTEDAVMIDTAGRYVEQESRPDVDSAEWLGFLDMLKKHRGERALNGVILTLSVETLMEGDHAIRTHGREIRKRLAELSERLEIRLPIYLMLTKADLIKGFVPFFEGLSTAEREQVWGATFPTDDKISPSDVGRELSALAANLERRMVPLLEDTQNLDGRAEIFRFPAQIESLSAPLRLLVETIFGESRYEESAWMRGFYFTSATQEGTPIDRLMGSLAASFGLRASYGGSTARFDQRSFFIKDLLTRVIFQEAGLGTLDPDAVARRKWAWRGIAAAAAAVTVVMGLLFTLSYMTYRGEITDQTVQLEGLRGDLTLIAAQQAPVEPLDLNAALDAMNKVALARTPQTGGILTALGPAADAELDYAYGLAYNRALRNILEPRMVALLEATMWKEIRNPEYLLNALKVYQMLTGAAPVDTPFAQQWWAEELPKSAPIDPFPTQQAVEHQMAVFERIGTERTPIEADQALLAQALEVVCEIPLSQRAYNALLADPEITALPEWIPASYAGPNANDVLVRQPPRTLRNGIKGAFTYNGFHTGILARIDEVANQAALDRWVFAGGCAESADVPVATLAEDILKLYYEDYINTWDLFLREISIAPINDLRVANDNLKDLSSDDSAVKRLLDAVVAETDLTRTEEEGGGGGGGVPPKAVGAATKRLGFLGKLLKRGARYVPSPTPSSGVSDQAKSGEQVAKHFAPIKGVVQEVEGIPPLLTDVQTALKELANVFQRIAASADPEAELVRLGGIAQLTGAVANTADTLPDPVDDWIRGIAGDAERFQASALENELNAIWRADVLPFCQSALANRYPFTQGSSIDVNTADFARLFGPNGLMDSFTNDKLLPLIDTTTRPWTWRGDIDLDPAKLAPFEQARSIRDGLFPGGAGPLMGFNLLPESMSANAARATLNIDGQVVTYFHNAAQPQSLTWPGTGGTNTVTLQFAPLDGSAEVILSENGAWAWLRMIRGGLSPTGIPERFNLRLGAGGMAITYQLNANSVDNPFDLKMFGSFTCPERF